MDVLEIKNLTFSYPNCPRPVFKNLSLALKKGDFAVVCGGTGCGKSTLLRLIKRELAPRGDVSGNIFISGRDIYKDFSDDTTFKVGLVMQNPDQQTVTDKVWHELAFGLENMGMPRDQIARRICEMASYFGIEHWFDKSINELSGGQKQLLNLAAVMVTDPEILILDEPMAQLDPIAAGDFMATLKKLSDDLGLTVIIAEHRLEDLIPLASKLIVFEEDGLICMPPREAMKQIKEDNPVFSAIPAPSRVGIALEATSDIPMTVKEGRAFVQENFSNNIRKIERKASKALENKALEMKKVCFSYEKDQPDVLKELDLCVYEGEIFCILGGNGSGKSTTLMAACGNIRPYSGKINVFGKKISSYKDGSLYKNCLSLLPQDPQTLFLKNTVKEELDDMGIIPENLPFDLSALYEKHPYDLSGGEQQLLALAKVLARDPRLLLMDEPTKGLDSQKKLEAVKILKKLKENGVTVVCVTHDVEFAALCADRCAMFFKGQTVYTGTADGLFCGNKFYTTAASRMTKGYFENAITADDVIELCRKNGRKNVGGMQ